jgi:predicted house-cleaning NTP pyrophosphatase (Maf/HAM1 superfamily)
VEGSESNVVGLPLELLAEMLREIEDRRCET